MSRIFLVSLSFLLFVFSSKAMAQNTNPYSVENIAVNVSGKTPTDARNIAVATARRDAFLVLLSRLEINVAIANIITNEEIADMVMSEQIDNEKIAGNSYFATFNILFAKNFVDHILGKKNLQNIVLKEVENCLIIPVKKLRDENLGERNLLWEESNDWKMAIVKNVDAKRNSSESKFIVPDADIENLAVLSRDNISSMNFNAFQPMMERYNANKVYTLFFSHDQIENKILIDVFLLDRLQKKQFRLSFVNAGSSQYEVMMGKVAAKTVEYLFSLQRSQQTSESSVIKMQVNFSNLERWLELKNKIENSGVVADFTVESISRDYANLIMKYSNSQVGVVESFAKIGINVEQKADNFYIVF
jgi:hypothetical protein